MALADSNGLDDEKRERKTTNTLEQYCRTKMITVTKIENSEKNINNLNNTGAPWLPFALSRPSSPPHWSLSQVRSLSYLCFFFILISS